MDETTDPKNFYIPYEVVTIILGHMLPYKTIIQCRLVCKMWKHIIENESWRYVVKLRETRTEPYSDAEIGRISRFPWYILHAMCSKDGIFGRKFIMTKHRFGNACWKLTDPDSRCWNTIAETDKNELSHNDEVFTFKMQVGKLQNSSKVCQIIKLPKCGLSQLLFKTLRPRIRISLWACLEGGMEGQIDGPKYHVIVSLRDSALALINEDKRPDKSNQLRGVPKGVWKMVLLPEQKASEKSCLDSILIEHQLHNSGAKCAIGHILIHIDKPDFLAVDWNTTLICCDILRTTFFESMLISEYPLLLERADPTRVTSLNLLPNFESYFDLLAFPESKIFIPGIWYGRPLADVIKLKDDDVETSICYENSNYLLLYELKCQIRLKEHGLFGYLMDDLQPVIEAYVKSEKTHRDRMKYEMTMSLLDNEGKILHRKEASRFLDKYTWREPLMLTFEKYGPGVRYVVFSIRRHMSMNKCTQHSPVTFSFLNHVRNVINSCRLKVFLPEK